MSEDADRPSLEEAVRAEIQRLRRERHAAESGSSSITTGNSPSSTACTRSAGVWASGCGGPASGAVSAARMLAQIVGVHPSTIGRAERSGRVSHATLVAICRVLGVTADWTAMDELAAGD